MRTFLAKTMGIVALLAASSIALAWEEPDAVYAKFHNAVLTGNMDEMIRLTPSARRSEVAMHKETELQQHLRTTPTAYALEQKLLSRDGQTARLFLSASGELFPVPKAGSQFGIVRMALESGEWRVIDQSWAREKPAELSPARAQVSEGGRVRDVTRPAAPTRAPVLRAAGPGCRYEPVMSDEEIERCR